MSNRYNGLTCPLLAAGQKYKGAIEISAFILTFLQGDPEEEIVSVSEGNEQTWSCFMLFISWTINSNRADYTLNWREKKKKTNGTCNNKQVQVINYMSLTTHLCLPSRSQFPHWKRPRTRGGWTSSTALLCYGRPSRRSPPPPNSSRPPWSLSCNKVFLRGGAVQSKWRPENDKDQR